MIVSHQLARLRGLAVALVVLALTAGAVLAGDPPPAADHGLDNAAERSGHEVLPVGAESDEELDEETDEDAPEADEQSEHENGDTHGALVSEAAQMETPAGFDTHGAFVSCVARMNRGQLGPDADLSALVLADLTTEDCAPDADDETADADAASASADGSPGKSGAAKARQASRGPRGNSPNH
jgi:hypothetical protein